MENENLIGVYLKLLSVLECPVCLDYLTKPVAVCNEGHALCSKCKANVSSCPLCRNPISSTRGLIVDQIIETLLYPCYKMGCGSLLRRTDAENHDLNCTLENAADKQAVLHNNLLKNIEENFASFIVQPEIVKETRTVGTVTGKVKTADARIQTSLPFTSSLLEEKLNSSASSAGCSSAFSGHPKSGPLTGISIRSLEKSPNTSFKPTDFSSIAFSFPQTSFGQNAFAFSMTPDGLNNTNVSTLFSHPQESPFQNINGFIKGSTASQNSFSRPFMFNYTVENSSGDVSKNISKKPSTNLSFTMESGPSRKECEPGATHDFFIRNQGTPISNLSYPSSSLSPGDLAPMSSIGSSNLENKTIKNKPSTNLMSCSTLVNNISNNSSQPFLPNDSLMAATQSIRRKRPSTNLCGLTTPA